ncbi:hypothetical protein [Rhodococcus maanshanensis]|uniref:Uncharacterized protein n=1 Tax=Rhodococcus maanshanensis TaxID=183556 RepID=A0A1H7RCK2_9NOCA|nr:hypothetical protein [Rhodococcus maanshanensis]SEL57819.1 hypothetical protein SAMN05444583_11138 [Rhodococcus maanshanensis]
MSPDEQVTPTSNRPLTSLPGADAVFLTIGAAVTAAEAVGATARFALDTLRRVPGLARRLDATADALRARGEDVVRTAAPTVQDLLRLVIREVVAAALLEVDLTRLVRENVDLNLIAESLDLDRIAATIDIDAIAARLDVDAVIGRLDLDGIVDSVDLDRQIERVDLDEAARRIDIDAIIARVDLVGLADEIIEGVDLPDIIRESTGSLSSEAVRGVRSQGMQADDAVAGFVGRLFGRGPGQDDELPMGGDDRPGNPAP